MVSTWPWSQAVGRGLVLVVRDHPWKQPTQVDRGPQQMPARRYVSLNPREWGVCQQKPEWPLPDARTLSQQELKWGGDREENPKLSLFWFDWGSTRLTEFNMNHWVCFLLPTRVWNKLFQEKGKFLMLDPLHGVPSKYYQLRCKEAENGSVLSSLPNMTQVVWD